MLIECATITDIESDLIKLKSQRGSACERCARGEGCGGGVIGRLVFRRDAELDLAVDNAELYSVGQTVELSLEPAKLVRLAATLYLVPLLMLITGAALGHWWIGSDVGAIVGALMGVGGGAWLVRQWLPSMGSLIEPSILLAQEEARP